MTHFGIICPPVSGHIHPFGALGRELTARGHKVTVFHMPDLEPAIRSEGLEFHAIGSSDHPLGSLPASLRRIGAVRGAAALRLTIDAVAGTTEMLCRDGPEAVRTAGVDALLVDQMEPAGGAIAEHLALPFFTVCNALALNRDPLVPPPFTPWTYSPGRLGRLRNRLGYAVSDRFTRPISRVVARYRRRWNLPALRSPDDSFSRLAQVCQMPREFDFPRLALPPGFHYVGPLRRARPNPHAFPWDRLDGRPLAYASLGTLQNRREPVFRCIAEACRALNLQVVIAHGGGLTDREAANLPGNPVAVAYAPQLDVLERAQLTITHAGLNTVLDSLARGVPLVTIPLTYEQPAIARRVEWTGAGRTLVVNRLSPRRLTREAERVLAGREYRDAAGRMARAMAAAGGVVRAADLVQSLAVRC